MTPSVDIGLLTLEEMEPSTINITHIPTDGADMETPGPNGLMSMVMEELT